MTILTKNHAQLTKAVAESIAADALVTGTYWNADEGKGCFIGCLAHSNDPRVNEENYGLPVAVQRIAESIFEDLPIADGKAFFADLPAAVGSDGKDLTRVCWAFLAAELRALPPVKDDVQAAIDTVIAGMDKLARGEQWSRAAAEAARAAADAAADAARAAARGRQRDTLLRLISEAPAA